MMENRFKMLTKSDPQHAKELFRQAQIDADRRYKRYEHLAAWKPNGQPAASEVAPQPASPQQRHRQPHER